MLACLALPMHAMALDLSITDSGAVADGQTVNTVPIQKAIDQVHGQGGGRVLVPKGRFVTGTLYLKSHVRLVLLAEAVLLGSRSLADYPTDNPGSGEVIAHQKAPSENVMTAHNAIQALIVADQAMNTGIEGPGTIDGRGQPDAFPVRINDGKDLGLRPMLMRFHKCQNVRIEDVTLRNAASWGVHLVDCDKVYVQRANIHNRANENNDGLDIDGCRDVHITHCNISSGDDAICLKSSFGKPNENIFVRNCVLSSNTSAFKTGTSSRAGFRNIIISDCVMREVKMGAIKLLCVDGGTLENVLIQNILMDRVEGPLFIRLGNRGESYETPEPGGGPVKVGAVRNITVSNVRATVTTTDKVGSGIMISGIPGHSISNIRLANIDIRFPGMGPTEPPPRKVPEDENRYPEQSFFGALPSYGMFIRHASDVDLHGVRLGFEGEEKRPAFVLDNVHGFTLRNSTIQSDGKSVIEANNSSELWVANCRVTGSPPCLIESTGHEGNGGRIFQTGNLLPKDTRSIHWRK
jgi:polygalacturonase